MKQRITLITLFLSLVFNIFAQDISISVSAPKVVEEGTLFHVRYSINTDPGNQFSIETCEEIQASGRPQTGSSSSISIVNGNVSKNYTYTETRQFRATKKGTFPLPVATIKIDGKTYKSKVQNIEVVDNTAAANAAAQTQQQMRQQNNGSNIQQQTHNDPKPETASDDMFARVFVNKSSAYIGEPILATIKLYTQKDITGINDNVLPDFNGFFKRVLEQPQKLEYQEENINGKVYYSILFQRVVIYPQKDGKLTISPFKVDCNVITGMTSGGFWGFPQRQIDRRIIESKPVSITVKPFPAGKSADFSGAVGNFSITAKTDVSTIPANEAFSLKVTVKGEGNFSLLTKPNIAFHQDFEVYDPKITDNYSITANGDKGSKTFEYVILPRREGNFVIPSIKLQYFDVNAKTYKTISTDEIQITVTKGTNNSSVVSNYTPTTKEDVQFGSDIHFIKTGDLHIANQNNFFFKTTSYWIITILIILSTLLFIIFKRKQIELRNDVSGMKKRGANKESKKRLKTAGKYLESNEDILFYEEIAKALWGYIADKFTIAQVDLTTDKIKERLLEHKIDEQLIDKLIQVLQRCEFARFAPSANTKGKEELYTEASSIIQEFEQKIK
ncbi:MAG: BatD family protein [Bacteroidales bacterium]|nr:BatD family protein [Bacteroidales bacterium]